jgi:phosphoglycolate phosphatase-like HAD superfamily hydrolase
MRAGVEHIVWDWNGTLFSDSGALIEATVEAFRRCGLPVVTRDSYQRHHTQPIPAFYDRLAGRRLSDGEQLRLAACFREAYARHRQAVALTTDAVRALTWWTDMGGRQSLLSMYPHRELVPLVTAAGIAHHFTAVDGSTGTEVAHKAPHLARHLRRRRISAASALLVGDSVDDVRAAAECGLRCVVYHPGAAALHARDHFSDLGVPIVASLRDAVAHAGRWS